MPTINSRDLPPRLRPGPGQPKYRNLRTVYGGVVYASKAEADYARHLDEEGKPIGVVKWWIGQPKFRLGVPENVYVPDFLVVHPLMTYVVDVKGMRTPKFNRDVKLWRAYGPCQLHIVTRRGSRWDVEVIEPNPLETT